MDTTVLDLPAPTAARLRRPGWRDPRLLVGIALIASSVVLGSWAVTTAQRTVPVYVARDVLVPGAALSSAALVVADVRLADRVDGYLRADEPLPDGAVLLRTVGAGELVPVAAVGDATDLDVRAVPVALSGPAPSGLQAGSRVDLWFTPEPPTEGATEPGGDAVPRELAAGLTVAELSSPDGAFASGGARTAHVLVPVDDLPTVLGALAGRGTVDLVPVPGA
ncbi:conserved hypothetical protein [Cellulomonas flavigena DSM 20109]|uniref:SAF domain protein n=1 Tax=Cellulomonas flavigena (strain ATCC 482 / DSM 20109 / BCRC 11376 / JCM 18109 / NBRC 3775 / NCIMB 8073 / NRS 134) TaxID=446466 RepID=D5UGW2_CELFN|nr:hypothetical protein [Cellulomonas flavigena]ADG75210.1 conserved hypothetical protein [Cellulomonas flavigena DSM 20109]